MVALDPALQAHLDGGATTLCDCWIIRRADGLALGVTDHDGPLTVEGVLCRPQGQAQAGVTESALGMAADSVELLGALSADAITAEDLRAGLYDGARIERWRVNWADPNQRLRGFAGRLGAVTLRGVAFAAEVMGPEQALNRVTGRAYLRTCDADLGDARCGVDLDRPDRSGRGAVAAAAGAAVVLSGLDAISAGALAHGVLRWEGAPPLRPARIRADVATPQGRRLSLDAAPEGDVTGRTVAVEVGCDRTLGACARFANVANFRGFPHLPGDDWLTAAPQPGGRHDGGRRDG
jgi:uncharacterized phage protein (TIGR02218 family)